MKSRECGFGYRVSRDMIEEYGRWPVEKRLAWLYQGNVLRKAYPRRIIELQDKFREGKI